MLNLTRLHLGIAHESQFQGRGISGSDGMPWCCADTKDFCAELACSKSPPLCHTDQLLTRSFNKMTDQSEHQRTRLAGIGQTFVRYCCIQMKEERDPCALSLSWEFFLLCQ
jgi:hypothetical protein